MGRGQGRGGMWAIVESVVAAAAHPPPV